MWSQIDLCETSHLPQNQIISLILFWWFLVRGMITYTLYVRVLGMLTVSMCVACLLTLCVCTCVHVPSAPIRPSKQSWQANLIWPWKGQPHSNCLSLTLCTDAPSHFFFFTSLSFQSSIPHLLLPPSCVIIPSFISFLPLFFQISPTCPFSTLDLTVCLFTSLPPPFIALFQSLLVFLSLSLSLSFASPVRWTVSPLFC